jgi:DMSO/TMAO reductase YedYZ molybdopterin-dependent catalytic subunit
MSFLMGIMEYKSRTRIITRIVVVLITVMLTVTLVVVIFYPHTPTNRFYPTEVRDYQGEKLDSVANVYENAIKGTQYISQSAYRLTVNGLVNRTKEYTYSEVLDDFKSYEKVVTIHCVEGWSANILWKGVLVRDLLDASGVNDTAKVVIFHAQDGYTTSMPVSYFYSNNVIMAYKMNNITIPPERGFPFELVAESKYGYKWIKWITQIELSADENYLGFWESNGFSNDATVP